MLLPGRYDLYVQAITAALTAQVQPSIDDLDGMLAATITAEVIGFTGGSSISAVVRTSLDGGTVWFDVARFDFSGAGKKYANLSGLTAKGITAYAALNAEGVNDGLLGPMWGTVITSVGTFTNTNLAVRLNVR